MVMVDIKMLGLAVVATCVLSSVTATNKYVVPKLDFPSNGVSWSKTEMNYLAHVLKTDGIVAVTNVPELKQARLDTLTRIVQCTQENTLNEEALSIHMKDGTKRVTLGWNKEQPDNEFGCDGLGSKLKHLQTIIDKASMVYARALDATVVNPDEPLLIATNNPHETAYRTFESIVKHGDHLDHLHVYEASVVTDEDTLDMHTDQGLFVAFIPSLIFNNNKQDDAIDGFEVEVNGNIKEALFPKDDTIVFMLGDGTSNWLSSNAFAKTLRSGVPHRLVMNHLLGSNNKIERAWFGRMFFPPKDAYLALQETTFDRIRLLSLANHEDDFVGCSSSRHLLRDLTDESCAAGSIYCWMACRDTTSLSCTGDQTAQCVNNADGTLWPPSQEANHCFTCGPQCYSESAGANPVNNTANPSFCVSQYPTNMYMDGFEGLDPNIPCLVFLFKTWVMDTPTKFAFGSLGAFAIGLVIEAIILCRKEMKAQEKRFWLTRRMLPNEFKRPRVHSAVMVTLYGSQLVLAYFAMLLAMSFSAVIFSMVMLGLILGHYLFNFDTKQIGGNEACCSSTDEIAPTKQEGNLKQRILNGSSGSEGAACCNNNSQPAFV